MMFARCGWGKSRFCTASLAIRPACHNKVTLPQPQHQQQALGRTATKLSAVRWSTFSAGHGSPTPGSSLRRPKRTNEETTTTTRQVLLQHLDNNENVPGGLISILTLNRPKAANAMGTTMLQQLQASLTELEEQGSSRCVILASALPRVFSAGADLKERRTMSLTEAEAFVTNLRQTLQRVCDLPMPVIGAVEGLALGGGLELALCADMRIASSTAVFGLVETSLAIVPGAGGTQRLPRLIGASRAKELIFTAQKISAVQALEYGVVDHVVDGQQHDSDATSSPVMDKAMDLAWQIAKNGPVAVRSAKQAIDRGLFAASMQDALDVERECYGQILSTQDRLEGLAAFAEKRAPHYKGK